MKKLSSVAQSASQKFIEFAISSLFIAAVSLLAAGPARATESSLTLVVPFASGGPTDRIARAFADAAQRHQPGLSVHIENVSGGGGTVAAAKVAKAPADGSVVLLQNIAMSAAPAMYANLPYDTLEDFEYIGLFQEVPMMLVGRGTLPPDLAGLRSFIGERRGDVKLAHAGVGSASHLCGLLIQSSLNQRLVEKAYPGNAPAIADLLSGRVDLLCDPTTSSVANVQAGRVRAYGLTTSSKVHAAALKQVPTLHEVGLPNAQITVWFGLVAPKGTPLTTQTLLNGLMRTVASDADFVASQEAAGAVVVNDARLAPTIHKRFVAKEIDHWRSVIGGISLAGERVGEAGQISVNQKGM